jgi:hypothetical protein
VLRRVAGLRAGGAVQGLAPGGLLLRPQPATGQVSGWTAKVWGEGKE